jgi:hypothetical protein
MILSLKYYGRLRGKDMPNCETIFHHSNQGCDTLWPCHLKLESIKAKEELWKLKYFTMQEYIILKKSSRTNQNPSRYYNSITNLKFEHKPKYHVSKTLI